MSSARRTRAAWAVAAFYGLGMLVLVFGDVGWALNRLTVRLYVIARSDFGLRGIVPEDVGHLLNVLLFVPLGILVVTLLRRGWITALAVSVLLSAAVEVVQILPALGRDASVADVVTNALGGLLGACVALGVRRVRT